MPRYPKNYKGAEYYAPRRKRPIAVSTIATSEFLAMVHKTFPTFTISQLKEVISDRRKYIVFPEALEVLDVYIKAGYGDHIPKWR